MATTIPAPTRAPADGGIPSALFMGCFVLFVINVTFFPASYLQQCWIYDKDGLGIPTDFVNVWAAGRFVLDGHPALAYDWGIQKKVEVAILGQDFAGDFAWHYPPPLPVHRKACWRGFLMAWPSSPGSWPSLVPYLVVMRAIVGRPWGWMLAFAVPMVIANAMVGQNGFLTAALIGGAL